MDRPSRLGEPGVSVRGLKMPDLLIWLLAHDRWQHPGDEKMREVILWFEDPLVLEDSRTAFL